ncbi:hypothetical protein [Streptomyces sp. ICN441]|uniref:hypothetical protein n=1 Tax=Streptomyces sp. ICN441 TaxID=2558286 RepID=UPI001F0E4C0D|nr:hypothetical protein [Streptomyces sp. ICN441]
MADSQFSAPPMPAHAAPHPMARPGYGKRTTSGQPPRTAADFAHLPPREGAIAAYIDRLADGTDISVKTLAKVLPYGQCALRTALNRIQESGHLRRGREHSAGSGSPRGITRTWWSRAPRDDTWWAAYRRGDVPEEGPRRPTCSRAVILLAALGREAPVMSLSAAECAQLAPLVEEWFARGAHETQLMRALTSGLPVPVHHPAALARTRLTTKLPPERRPVPPLLRVLECGKCGAPARAEALRGGDCAACRGEPAPPARPAALPPSSVRAHAAEARAAARSNERSGT